MVRKGFRMTVLAVALAAAWSIAISASRSAMAVGPRQGTGDLFYNFYVPPGPNGGVGAQLYPCPRPTPPLVGHTYITYQPLMPHEFMYKHHRVYYTCNQGSGPTRTRVSWR
jgi:hypothetical protein